MWVKRVGKGEVETLEVGNGCGVAEMKDAGSKVEGWQRTEGDRDRETSGRGLWPGLLMNRA